MTTSKPTGPATQSKMSETDLAEAKALIEHFKRKGLITIRPGIPAKPDHEKKEAVMKKLATKARNRFVEKTETPIIPIETITP